MRHLDLDTIIMKPILGREKRIYASDLPFTSEIVLKLLHTHDHGYKVAPLDMDLVLRSQSRNISCSTANLRRVGSSP